MLFCITPEGSSNYQASTSDERARARLQAVKGLAERNATGGALVFYRRLVCEARLLEGTWSVADLLIIGRLKDGEQGELRSTSTASISSCALPPAVTLSARQGCLPVKHFSPVALEQLHHLALLLLFGYY